MAAEQGCSLGFEGQKIGPRPLPLRSGNYSAVFTALVFEHLIHYGRSHRRRSAIANSKPAAEVGATAEW
jgi:hypothetical protein